MAITKNNLTPAGAGFAVNASSSDAQGCEELVAAPGTGKSLYLTQIQVSCVSAITVTIGAGKNGAAVLAVLLGPFNFAATSGSPVNLTFRGKGIKLTANTSLTVDTSGAGAIQIYAEGYIQ
jgi:hypothetical protein